MTEIVITDEMIDAFLAADPDQSTGWGKRGLEAVAPLIVAQAVADQKERDAVLAISISEIREDEYARRLGEEIAAAIRRSGR